MHTLLRRRKQLIRELPSHTLAGKGITRGTPQGPSWPGDETPSLPAAPSSQSDRPSRCCYCHGRRASGEDPWTLSNRSRASHVGPGYQDLSAQVIVSEIGTDMSRFPSDQHLISWAGICSRSDESAGKRRSNRLRKGLPGSNHVGAVRLGSKELRRTATRRAIYRIKACRGPKKAIMAVAASILTAIYHMLKDGTARANREPRRLP